MALRNSMTTASGLAVPVAYTRVESVVIDPKNKASFNAMTYNFSPDAHPHPAIVSMMACDVDPDKKIHAQLYEFLKTQEAWASAVDC